MVIPTYNERDNIESILNAVLEQPEGFDVLVVDDSSPDGTSDIVKEIAAQNKCVKLLSRTGQRGLGLSYVDGFKYAVSSGYDAIFEMDADFSHDPADLGKLLSGLEEHDMVMGSRYVGGRVSVLNWPITRLALSMFAGIYVRFITGMKVSDPTSGYRGYRSCVLESIGLDTIRSNGYCFQVEMLYRAYKLGFSIFEVPIVFTERSQGQSKMSKGVIGEAILMPWKLRFSRLRRSSELDQAERSNQ